MLLYLVVYDIPDDKRRQKVANLLEGYGRRVQFSVFECVLAPAQYQELQTRLQARVNLTEDSVRFYPLSRHTRDRVVTWGGPPVTEFPGSIVV